MDCFSKREKEKEKSLLIFNLALYIKNVWHTLLINDLIMKYIKLHSALLGTQVYDITDEGGGLIKVKYSWTEFIYLFIIYLLTWKMETMKIENSTLIGFISMQDIFKLEDRCCIWPNVM